MTAARSIRRPHSIDRRAYREGSLAGTGLSLATAFTALMVIVAFTG
jgi:hypothetical protein